MNIITLPVQRGPQPQHPPVLLETTTWASSSNSPPLIPFLVGREAELAQLHKVLEKAMGGERQILFLSGEAGMGKTTLVDVFVAHLCHRVEVRVTSGQCVEQYGPGEAYMPLLEATQRLCRGPGGEQRVEALKRYAPSWLAQLPSLQTPEDRYLLQQRVQGTSRERMLREMAEAAELFTTRRGLVVVLEDLHWSDVSTLDWITYMARRREPAKLLILGTYRPTETASTNHPLRAMVQGLLTHRHSKELRVTPLSKTAIGEYLRARFGEIVLPEAVVATLARRTGGNPLFVVNTVDYFVRQGAVTEEAGQWIVQADKVNEVGQGIPDTLRQLIERQVERLSEAEQHLLEVASSVGVEFATVDVAAGLSTTVEEIEASCERLARAGQWLSLVGFVESPDGTVGGRYSFLHAMYHEVIYSRITEVRRIQLHRRIAAHKEAVYRERVEEIAAELAVHFENGRDLTRAVHYLGKAGQTAMRRSAHQEAIVHCSRGLNLLATFPDTLERKKHELALQVGLAVPLLRTKGYAAPEVANAYGRARELCEQIGEQPELFTALAGLCSFYLVRAELHTARMLAEQCVRLAQRAQDSALLVEAYFILGVTLLYSGELMDAQAALEYGKALYDPRVHRSLTLVYGQDPGVGCRSYASLASWLLGYPDRALEESHDALSLARELAHSFTIGAALHTAIWLRQYRQEGHAVQAHAEEEIALSEKEGFALWLTVGMIQRGWVLSEQGDNEQGLGQMRKGIAALNATGARLSQPYHLALLAQAHGKSEQPHEGLTLLDQALTIVDTIGERYYEAELYRLRGELTLAGARDWGLKAGEEKSLESQVLSLKPQNSAPRPLNPDPQVESKAEACFQKAITLARAQQAKSWELRAATSLARLWQSQGKLGEARALLEDIYEWFTEGFDTQDLQDTTALLSSLGSEKANQRTKGKKQNSEQAESVRLQAQGLSEPFVSSLRPLVYSFSQSPVPSPQSLSTLSSLQPTVSSLSQSSTPNLFRPEGDYWTVSFANTTCRLKDARGLHFIAHLLQHPHQEVHVLTLITMGAEINDGPTTGPSFQDSRIPFAHLDEHSDAGELLDPRARAAYKQRLRELREELAEAQQFHDLGRSQQLAAEIDFLTHELARAVGLGGRVRRVGSHAERARVNITRAVKIALRKISEHHPALGQHLATTIKTGTYCSYTPDIRLPITWQG
ncbi:MAG: AAA family ATPase [Candidatus Binatia bacterium]